MRGNLILMITMMACLMGGAFSQVPFYAESTYFYSNQATVAFVPGQTTIYTLPTNFTISTQAHQEPFFAACLASVGKIRLSEFFYHFIDIWNVNSTAFQILVDSFQFNSTIVTYYGFEYPSNVAFRYMNVLSTFPNKYISLALPIASTLWSIPAGGSIELLYNVGAITTPPPVVLSATDTVFAHSLASFRLVSTLATLNSSFELTVTFRVVNTTQFGLKLKAKYPLTLDTLDDGSVRVFIYNKLDFQNLYARMDYQILIFSNLMTGTGSKVVKTYTAPYNPASTITFMMGFNGMELSGYSTYGYSFVIDGNFTGLNYNITLNNLLTTSAIPRLDLFVLVPSQLRCPSSLTLVDSMITICYTVCPAGTYKSPTPLGISGIYMCIPCSPTCATCTGTATNCTSCFAAQNRALSINACIPMPGFYQTGVPVAPACHYSCMTCTTTSTFCTSCNPTNFRTLTVNTCPPNAGYYDAGVPLAAICHYTCKTCSGPLATNCLTCNTAAFRTFLVSNNSCPPNPGYYDNGAAISALCHYSCMTCVGVAMNCTSCSSANFRTFVSNSCPPNPGYFDAGVAAAVPCSYTCGTCSLTATNCTTCIAANHRTLAGNMCPPDPGYYDNSVAMAAVCHYSCTTCSAATATSCLTCSPLNFRVLTGTSCPPITGYYDAGVAVTVPCHYSCLTCSITSTNCLTCDPANFRTLAGTSCAPNPGYFDSGVPMAVPCYYTCATCSITSTNCTTCSASNFRTLTGNTCLPNLGYYDNGSPIAVPCDYTCETCSISPTNCLTCSAVNFRTLVGNTCPPNDGYFDSGLPAATPCDYSCLTCSGTSTNCTSCDPRNFRTLVGNTCPPNPGFYDNGVPMAAPCDYTCATCSLSSTTCDSCNPADFRTLSGTSCPPNPGYFDNGLPSAQPCDYTCLTCSTTATTCISCDPTNFRTLNGTSCSPNPGYFDNGSALAVLCDPTCLQCSGTATNCTACALGFYVSSGLCLTCSSQYGSACTACTPTGCTGCQSGYVINSTSNLCITCSSYHGSCSSCNQTNCQSCSTGFTLDVNNSTCISCNTFDLSCNACTFSGCSGCLSGFVLNPSNICITCSTFHTSCASCNATNCQSCSAGFTLDVSNSTCIACSTFDASCSSCTSAGCSGCLTGFVLSAVSNTCITCSNYNPQCTGCNSTNCQSCSSGYFLDASTFVCSSCLIFSTQCLTCTQTLCQSCAAGFAVDSTQSSCVSCTTFDPNCVSCDPTGCQQCQIGFFLSSGTCQQCSTFGQQCTDCTASGCSACSIGYIVNQTDLKCIPATITCGDGLWITTAEQCDDGNLMNGDGCDSNCQVETDYECLLADQLPSGASLCKYTKNLSIQFVSLQKSTTSNSVSLLFNLEPSTFTQWDTTQIAKLISQIQIVDQKTGQVKNINSSNIKVSFIRNALTNQVEMVIDYGINNLQDAYLSFNIDPSSTNYSALQNLTIQNNIMVKISSDNTGVYLYDYNEETYQFQSMVSALSMGVGLVAFAMMFAGMFVPAGKIIMLEALAVTQIAFFSVLQFQKVPPTFIGLKNLIFSNGYNDENLLPASSPKDQTIYKLMGLQSEVLSNFNVDLILFVIAPALIGGFGYFLTRIPAPTQSTKESPKLLDDKENASETGGSIETSSTSETVNMKNVLFGRILHENTFYGLMICGYLAWVSIFHSQSKPDMTDYAAAAIVVVFQVAFCVLFVRSELSTVNLPSNEGKNLTIQTEFGQFNEVYTTLSPKTASKILKKFYLVLTFERLINSLMLALLASSIPAGGLILGIYTVLLAGMVFIFKKTNPSKPIFSFLDKNYVLRQSINFITIILIEASYLVVSMIAQSSGPYETFVNNDMVVKDVPLIVVSLTFLNLIFNAFLWVRQIRSQNLLMKAKTIFSDLSANVTKYSEKNLSDRSINKSKNQDDEFNDMLNNLRNSSPTLKPKESPFLGMMEATDKKSAILDILKKEKMDLDTFKKQNQVEYKKFMDSQWDEI